MRKFCVYTNAVCSTQRALAEIKDDKVVKIISGDLHYDRICDKIEGFFECLEYIGVEYRDVNKFLSPDDGLFHELGFVKSVDWHFKK